MAKYQLTSPEGRKFEVTAPDDATEEQVYQFFQQQTQPTQSREEQIDAEARKRQAGNGNVGTTDLIANSAGINVSPYIAGAGRGLTNYLTGKRLSGEAAGSLGEEYARERDIYKRQIDLAREGSTKLKDVGVNVPDLPIPFTDITIPTSALNEVPLSELAGGFAMAPSRAAAMTAAPAAAAPTGGRIANFLTGTKEMAAAGAMWGFPAGFNEAVGKDYIDKAKSGYKGAVTGAILGPVIGHGINAGVTGVRAIKAPFDQMKANRIQERSQNAANVASDMRAAGLDPDTVPLAQAPEWQQATGDLVGSSWFGQRVRDNAERAMQQMHNEAQARIAATGGNETPANAGERIRDFTRNQMLDPNRDMHHVRNMTDEQLQGLTGFPPRNPPMETEFPSRPNTVEPVSTDAVVQSAMDAVQPVQPRQVGDVASTLQPVRPEDVRLPPETLKRVQKAQDEAIGLRHQHDALEQTINENMDMMRQLGDPLGVESMRWVPGNGPQGEGGFFSLQTKQGIYKVDWEGNINFADSIYPPTPELENFAKRGASWLAHSGQYAERLNELKLGIDRSIREVQLVNREADLHRAAEAQRLTEENAARARAQAEAEAQAEASVATQRAREQARDRAMLDAVPEAERRTRELQANENARAEAEARQAYQDALEQHQAQAEAPFNIGGTPESIRTQLDAAYEMTRRAAPRPHGQQGRTNPLGRRGNDANPAEGTAFTNALEDIMLEARGRGRVEGWNGQLFDESGALNPVVMNYIRENVPTNIASRIQAMSDRRAGGRSGYNIEALYDIRQQLREAAEMQWRAQGGQVETRTYDTAMLQLMRDGINRTITEVASNLGPKGRAFLAMRDKTDAAYSFYMNQYRRGLGRIFDQDADSMQIFNRVREGMRNGTNNFQTMERLYELAGMQGNATLNQTSLTGMLLSDMASRGPTEFLGALRNVSDDAWRVMFSGPNEQLGNQLRSMMRAGGYLERWIEPRGGTPEARAIREVLRGGNIATSLMGFLHIPSALGMAFGNHVAARIMTSPAYGRWLRSNDWLQGLRAGPASPEWKATLGRLGSIAARGLEEETAKKAKEVFDEMMGVKPAGALFAGEASQTKDWIALKIAQGMSDNREDPRKIYAETGWFQGKDGKWRYEMDDIPSGVTKEGIDAFKKTRFTNKNITTKLGTIFKHNALFEAFPQLKNVKVKFTNPRDGAKEMGEESNDWGASWISEDRLMMVNSTGVESIAQLRVFLLHEIQHILQDDNNFDYGPMEHDNYDKRYGEVEAYNVMRRAEMTPEQRRKSFPPDTQKVPFGQIQLSRPPATAQKGK